MVNRRKIYILSIFALIIIAIAISLGVYLTKSSYDEDGSIIVETSSGFVKGVRNIDGDYKQFLGIPYAVVNSSNPFGPSSPVKKSEEVIEALSDEKICPQIENTDYPGIKTLDCLRLNVFVPNSIPTVDLPVLVNLYGGSFTEGSSRTHNYGPKYIIKHEVILVTLNYRTGVYGFMCLDIPEVPGNQGLKDQVTALRWVQNNIKKFGGDPNKVTIFGQSAGGRSVDYHLMSEQEKLFDKAILQSGNSLCHPGLTSPDNTLPLQLANYLNYSTESVLEAITFLSNIDTTKVVNAAIGINYTFKACVEKRFANVESIINVHPLRKELPKVKDTQIIVGYTNNEKIVDYVGKDAEYFLTLNDFIKDKLKYHFDFDNTTLKTAENIVKRFYLGDEEINILAKEQIANFHSDFIYMHPQQRRIYDLIRNGANIYHYVFSHDGEINFYKSKTNLSYEDAGHSDELSYLFDVSFIKKDISKEDNLVINRLTTMWTNFAKYGDPTPAISDLLPVKWEPVTTDTLFYLNISDNLSLHNRPFERRLAFWDLFYKIYGDLQLGYL